jgi:AraC family transcriptional regulator of adaptative response/methylated-DNA-[protein]-cysteine methyltransferase
MEKITWGTVDTMLGVCTIVFSEDKVLLLGFYDDENLVKKEIFRRIGKTEAERDDLKIEEIWGELRSNTGRLSLHLGGTEFQHKVWEALCEIPFGKTATYTEIAEKIDRSTSVRVVANAIGANPIAFFVPCHRVIRTDGSLGGYRWGIDVKEKILAWEKSLSNQT